MYNLLVVDDEMIIRKGLLSLDWKSIDVNIAGDVDNGLMAVEILQSELVDIVLTDIRMPGMDGLELSEFIHKEKLNTEIIILSGYSDFEYARRAMQYGVTEYILKPSDPGEIFEAVKRAAKRVNDRRDMSIRLQLLEAELGKRWLIRKDNGIILGQFEHSDIAEKMLIYMAKYYKKFITLSDLSEDMHFSSIYLSKVIKKSTGYTFLELLNAMRVNDAAAKLREGNMSLTHISEAVCIKDPRYFSQVFKKHYGVTPSAYKKQPEMPLDTKLAYLIHSYLGEWL